jgi:hypothetical protein
VGFDGSGYRSGEVSGAAADVEHPVTGAGSGRGDQLGEEAVAAAAEEEECEQVVGSTASVEYARRGGACIGALGLFRFGETVGFSPTLSRRRWLMVPSWGYV